MHRSSKVIAFLFAVSLSGSNLYAQSGHKKTKKRNVPVQQQQQSYIRDSSSRTIPLEESFKAKIKKQHEVQIVPAKALQGSEPAQPEKPVPVPQK